MQKVQKSMKTFFDHLFWKIGLCTIALHVNLYGQKWFMKNVYAWCHTGKEVRGKVLPFNS